MAVCAGIAQSVQALARNWTNPGGGEVFRTIPERPWDPPSHLYNVYSVSFPGEKRRGVALATHLLLAPRLKKE